jgi:6-phosphogluconolactonase (cycloisomerase 2 family)
VEYLEEIDELLVPDLGADYVRRFKKSSDGTWVLQGHIQYELGGGPRHVVYHSAFAFVATVR